MKEWLVTTTSTSLAASRARSTKHSPTRGHLPPRHSCADTDTCRQARSETPGTSSSRSPESVLEAHSRRRTTSCPSRPTPRRPGRRREQAVLVVGEAALELVEAHVVAAALDEGDSVGRRPRTGASASATRGMSRSTIWRLQRQGGGRDDRRLAGCERRARPPGRGRRATCRCPCRPARAGARPSSMAARDRLGHLDLAGPLGAPDPSHRGVEEVVERGSLGHWIRVCRAHGASCRAGKAGHGLSIPPVAGPAKSTPRRRRPPGATAAGAERRSPDRCKRRLAQRRDGVLPRGRPETRRHAARAAGCPSATCSLARTSPSSWTR